MLISNVDDYLCSNLPDHEKATDTMLAQRMTRVFGGQQFDGTIADVSMTTEGDKLYLVVYDDGDVEHLLEEDAVFAVNACKGAPSFELVE